MLQNLKALLRSSASIPFDATRFGDPIANRTDWRPAKSGGASFRTRKLVAKSSERVVFRPTLGALAFFGLFLFVGLGLLIGKLWPRYRDGLAMTGQETLVTAGVGFAFAIVGAVLLVKQATPIAFDRRIGYYWRGRKSPEPFADGPGDDRSAVALQQIHALQILSELCTSGASSSRRSYRSYELNLVLKDARRLNVIDHGNLPKLRQDAETLAKFLGKPIWDAAG